MKTNAVEEVKYAGPGYGGGYGGRGGGGYPGRRWRYGCCRGYRYGPGCKRCCGSAHEAPDAEFEDDVKNWSFYVFWAFEVLYMHGSSFEVITK